jgi:hypothetical protein
VIARRIDANGPWSDLYASTFKKTASRPYLRDFLMTCKEYLFATLDRIVPHGMGSLLATDSKQGGGRKKSGRKNPGKEIISEITR